MLYDFLANCKCIFPDEMDDFQDVLKRFANRSYCTGFMPSITYDLYPVFALSCTSGKQIISPEVYIVPLGAHDYWAKPMFEDIFHKFYLDDEFREQYDIELEEMILLVSPDLSCNFTFHEDTPYNAIYCHFSLPDGRSGYLLFVLETPEDCWKKIIESYEIKCSVVIDSHKGMGDWFEQVPLYEAMRKTQKTELLPRYYFRGLYISCVPPCGFKLCFRIRDVIYFSDSRQVVEYWQKEIYEIDWDEINRLKDVEQQKNIE